MRVSLVVSLERLIFLGASIVWGRFELDFSDFFRSVQALLLDVLPQESGPADIFVNLNASTVIQLAVLQEHAIYNSI